MLSRIRGAFFPAKDVAKMYGYETVKKKKVEKG
jgi:hypothetical protein